MKKIKRPVPFAVYEEIVHAPFFASREIAPKKRFIRFNDTRR